MGTLREIKQRLSGVKNTQKITRAMKVVAATKLKREEKKAVGSRPFFVHIESMLKDLISAGMDHPYMHSEASKKILILVVSSDRGLCGAFNSTLTRKVYEDALSQKDKKKDVSFYVVGTKGSRFFEAKEEKMFKNLVGVDKKEKAELSKEIAAELTNLFLEKDFDEIWVSYNSFISRSSYQAVLHPFLPLAFSSEGESDEKKVEEMGYFDFEPSSKEVLNILLPMYLEAKIYRAFVESQASEESARMLAMDYASENASEIIQELTLQYNRLRQAGITREISEIVGGSEALN